MSKKIQIKSGGKIIHITLSGLSLDHYQINNSIKFLNEKSQDDKKIVKTFLIAMMVEGIKAKGGVEKWFAELQNMTSFSCDASDSEQTQTIKSDELMIEIDSSDEQSELELLGAGNL